MPPCGVGIPGPMSLLGGNYAWYQVPSWRWVYQRGGRYTGGGQVYQGGGHTRYTCPPDPDT